MNETVRKEEDLETQFRNKNDRGSRTPHNISYQRWDDEKNITTKSYVIQSTETQDRSNEGDKKDGDDEDNEDDDNADDIDDDYLLLPWSCCIPIVLEKFSNKVSLPVLIKISN